jgi:DNA-binding protein H-NS
LLTGDEQAEQQRQRAQQAEQRADRLAELLKSQGIDPDQLPE